MRKGLQQDVIKKLEDIVGEKHVLQDELSLEKYSKDETIGLQSFPDVAVRVRSAEEVSKILLLANEYKIPVTPRGLGTSLSGGSVPIHGGIVLSMERMDQLLEIDQDNLMAVTEPGIVTGVLHGLVEEQGCFYPPDPASKDSCSIGGNVAEGSGGPRAVRYGTTKDYVCGLEAVLPTGEIMHTGAKVVKDVTGYNLCQLLVGSEGTLAIVTNIILRLIPKPKMKVDLLAPFHALFERCHEGGCIGRVVDHHHGDDPHLADQFEDLVHELPPGIDASIKGAREGTQTTVTLPVLCFCMYVQS